MKTKGTLIESRWAEVKDRPLSRGAHRPDGHMCVVEMAAYVAGEPWSDHPACVSPAVAAFLRSWNDALDDGPRQQLKPYAVEAVGTNTGPADEERRAWLATDWLVRTHAPAWLDAAGLAEQAAALRALPELSSTDLAEAAMPTILAARGLSAAAGDAAGDAAGASPAPTARALQASALDLVDRMVAVGRTA